MTLVPTDPASRKPWCIVPFSSLFENTVDTIFEYLSTCASLHPDPATGSDDDEAFIDPSTEAQFDVFNGTADQELSEIGRVRSDYINNSRYTPY